MTFLEIKGHFGPSLSVMNIRHSLLFHVFI